MMAMIEGAVVGLAAAGVAALAADPLTRVLGPLVLLAVAVPAVAARRRHGGLAAMVVVLPMVAVVELGVLAVHGAWAVALAGVTTRRTAAANMFLAIAWLAWPVWLGPQIVAWGVGVPAWATAWHPLFAANAAVVDRLGVWTERPLAYALTPLGQDLAYAFPDSPWPAVVAHLAVGVAGVSLRRIAPARPHPAASEARPAGG